MGTYNTQITSDEYAMGDTLVIDEGGIDVLLNGEQEIAVSFEGLDPIRLMYDIMPEDEFGSHTREEMEAHRGRVQGLKNELKSENLEYALGEATKMVYNSILNLAAFHGWSK